MLQTQRNIKEPANTRDEVKLKGTKNHKQYQDKEPKEFEQKHFKGEIKHFFPQDYLRHRKRPHIMENRQLLLRGVSSLTCSF